MKNNQNDTFIFQDKRGWRWPLLRLALALIAVLTVAGAVVFIQALLVMPKLRPPDLIKKMPEEFRAIEAKIQIRHPSYMPPAELRRRSAQADGTHAATAPHPAVRLGFCVSWDPHSLDSLSRHAGDLTHVCPEWFSIAGADSRILTEANAGARSIAHDHDLRLMPLLTNLMGDEWQPEAVENLIRNDASRAAFLQEMSDRLKEEDAAGLVVNWEQVDPAYGEGLTRLIAALAEGLHAENRELWLIIPVGKDMEIFDIDTLSAHVDRFVALLHDETSDADPPGPISSREWFHQWLDALVGHGRPEQWIISIGAYGYEWTGDEGGNGDPLRFADVMARAKDANVQGVTVEPPEYNPNFSYTEEGEKRSVWFLDAVTFRNQLRMAEKARTGGVAVYRLGTEDPEIWTVLAPNAPDRPQEIEELQTGELISHVGTGDFISIRDDHEDGVRRVTPDPDGFWRAEYLAYPDYTTLYHKGADHPNQVAISFDDGPNSRWTPAILDILKEKKAPASFFIVGHQAALHPGIIQRIVEEGHEIGSHTYTHPNLAEISAAQLDLELNATQWLIEKITGRFTILFRPPYNADAYPHVRSEIVPLIEVEKQGYMIVCESIDAMDWYEPDAKTILHRVKQHRHEGNIVLLHDAGGDRSETIAALPDIIDWLRLRGDEIVPLHTLLGVPKETFLPAAGGDEQRLSRFASAAGFDVLYTLEEFFWAFMIVATLFTLIRTTLIAFLAWRHRAREKAREAAAGSGEIVYPPVSVLLGAYNEEKVIAATLRSILASDYPGPLEIVVVDDGSKDATSAEVRAFAKRDPCVRLVRRRNRGKAIALQTALARSSHEYIVTMDADTQIGPDALRHLVAVLLEDEKAGAVAGCVRVGNTRPWIAKFQNLEYTCGFNLDRRAYDMWDCVTVVPGAFSAYRREAIADAGGISNDTLAEDTDLTLKLHARGWRSGYASCAVAWTEAPETLRSLVRQRVRWAFGTLQCLWKHMYMVFNPQFRALAFFSIPSIWFFQFFLVAFIPVVDMMLVVSIVTGSGSAIIGYVVLFLLADLMLALVACHLEGGPLGRAWMIIPMRFIYRPLLSWAVWMSIARALRGAWVGWSKLDRTGGAVVDGKKP